jgi:Domain of unknown function (DUF4389)
LIAFPIEKAYKTTSAMEGKMDGLNEEDLKKNVKDKDTWLRFVYLVVFGIAFYISVLITFASSVLQFLAKLFSGSAFEGLAELGYNLATYQAQVTRYLTFSSDEKPFPFAPFPTRTDEPKL